MLGLCCYTWTFSACSGQGLLFIVVQGLLFIVVHGLLIAVASMLWSTGPRAHMLQELWLVSSVVAECKV